MTRKPPVDIVYEENIITVEPLIATVEKIIIGSHRLTKIYSISVRRRLDIILDDVILYSGPRTRSSLSQIISYNIHYIIYTSLQGQHPKFSKVRLVAYDYCRNIFVTPFK